MILISNIWLILAKMFHTSARYGRRYGKLEANNGAVFPYLPYLPYLFHTHIHGRAYTHTRARTRTHIIIINSMEGMEGMEAPLSMRLSASIPPSIPSRGMEHG